MAEVIIEILIEVFGELILSAIGVMFSGLYNIYDKNGATKKTVKNISVFILFGLILGLLIYSIFTKKGLYIHVVLIYMVLMFLLRVTSFIDRNYYDNKFATSIRIFKSIFHYAFASLVIYFASLGGVTKGEVWIIVLSSIGIAVFLTLDIFRIRKARRDRIIKKSMRK